MASAFRRKHLLCGILFGLQILNRPNVLVAVAGIVLVLLLIRNIRAAVLIAAGVLMALSPVMVRNAIVSRQFALSSYEIAHSFLMRPSFRSMRSASRISSSANATGSRCWCRCA